MGANSNECGRAKIVGFVGRSGSGKTTLLERVVETLVARGTRVGVVKHASHGFLADRPGKDSYRLYEAGAATVALVSSEQLATFTRQVPESGKDVPLAAALRSLPQNLDLVVVEGFSWEPIPRIVVVPRSEEALPEHLAGGEVLRIIEAPAPRAGHKPGYPESLISSVADTLLDHSGAPPPVATEPTARRRSESERREHG